MNRSATTLSQHLLTRSDLAKLGVRASRVLTWLAKGWIDQIATLPPTDAQGDPVFAVLSRELRDELAGRLRDLGKDTVVFSPLRIRSLLVRAMLLPKAEPAAPGEPASAAAPAAEPASPAPETAADPDDPVLAALHDPAVAQALQATAEGLAAEAHQVLELAREEARLEELEAANEPAPEPAAPETWSDEDDGEEYVYFDSQALAEELGSWDAGPAAPTGASGTAEVGREHDRSEPCGVTNRDEAGTRGDRTDEVAPDGQPEQDEATKAAEAAQAHADGAPAPGETVTPAQEAQPVAAVDQASAATAMTEPVEPIESGAAVAVDATDDASDGMAAATAQSVQTESVVPDPEDGQLDTAPPAAAVTPAQEAQPVAAVDQASAATEETPPLPGNAIATAVDAEPHAEPVPSENETMSEPEFEPVPAAEPASQVLDVLFAEPTVPAEPPGPAVAAESTGPGPEEPEQPAALAVLDEATDPTEAAAAPTVAGGAVAVEAAPVASPVPSASPEPVESAGMERVESFLGELRQVLVELAHRPEPKPVDVAPLIAAVEQGFARSQQVTQQNDTALAALGERIGSFGTQVEHGVALAVHAAMGAQGRAGAERAATVPAFLIPRPSRGTVALLAIGFLLLCWAAVLWFKTGSVQLAMGTLVGANVVGCCLLAGRRS